MPAETFRQRFRQSLSTPRAKDLLAVFFLIALPPVFFWRETLGWVTLGDQDAVFWFFPAYKFAAEQIRSGAFPLWNPYQYGGLPFFAEWQSGVLDPLNWLYWLGATSRTLTLSLELSFAVALLSMFGYARSLGFTRRASLVAALIYGLSGFLVGRTLYPGFLRIVALAPLVLYFTERLHQRGRWRDLIFGALIIAWQVFAAHPQPLIYSSLLACAYALFKLWTEPPRPTVSPSSRLLFLSQFALMFIAGIGLAAIQLFPAFEFATKSVRQEWPFEFFTANSLHPASLLVTLFPFFHGSGKTIYQMPYWGSYWHHNEAQIYLGAVALALALAGTIAAWRARYRIGMFWSVVAVAGVILAMGKYSGFVARLLYHVPLVSHFRSPNRHWMEVMLAVAVLAGYATDRLLREESRFLARCAQMSSALIALLCGAVGAFVLWQPNRAEALLRSFRGLEQIPPGFFQRAQWEFLLPMILAGSACLAILLFSRSRNRTSFFPLLLAILLIDFNLYAAFAPISNPEQLEPLIGRALPPALAAKQSEREPIRYQLMSNPSFGEFSPFWFYGHEMMTGYDPVLNERQKIFSGVDEAGRCFNLTMLESQDRTLDIFNVRYVMVPASFSDSQPSDSAAELAGGINLTFSMAGHSGDTLRIVSSLSNSGDLANDIEVAEVTVNCASGGSWKMNLRTGRDTSEWAYDREDVRRAVKHSRAFVAESWPGDAAASFQGHAYAAQFQLPVEMRSCQTLRTVQIAARTGGNVTLSIKRVELKDSTSSRSVPLAKANSLSDTTRWRELAERSPVSYYGEYRAYENLRALPRVWLASRAKVAYEGDQLKLIRGQIVDPDFDPRTTALVDHETAASLDPSLLQSSASSVDSRGKALFSSRTPTNLIVEAESVKPSVLVLSEMFYPGWQAKLDGRAVELLRVDYNLRGVSVPTGKHLVELSYRPKSVMTGAAVSLATALGLLAIFVWEKKRDRLKDVGERV
jgi:hypothetical protein